MNSIYLEIVGYIGTALILLSMASSSLGRLRIINVCGSFFSMTYSFLVSAYPVFLLNAALIIINLFKLFYEKRKKGAHE